MKKIIISLAALALFAGVAQAGTRSYDLRDLDTLNAYTSDGIYLPVTKGGVQVPPKLVRRPALTVFDHTGEHQNSTN
jgi:hypothetical protein